MVRFFGRNDAYTLDEAIEYLENQQIRERVLAEGRRLKQDRRCAEYAADVLQHIIEEFKNTRSNGPTPRFILEKLGRLPEQEER